MIYTILKKSIVIVYLLVPLISFSRQTVLDKKISIQAHNEPVANVLHRIEKLANVNFMYMSGLFDKNRHVNISFSNTTIKVILQKLIPSNDILLYVIDNKIIFYKKEEAPPGKGGTTVSLTSIETQNKTSIIRETEKRIIVDTEKVTIYDTVTITKYDTIRVTENIKSTDSSLNIPNKIKRHISQGIVLSCIGGVHFISETFKPNTNSETSDIIKLSEKGKSSRSEFGIGISYLLNHFSINSGIGFTEKNWSTEYLYTNIFTDSARIIGYSTKISWDVQPRKGPGIPGPMSIQLYDSTKIITKTPIYKRDTTKINYQGTNRASYFTIPVLISYTFLIHKNIYASFGSGITLYLLRKSEGYSIEDKDYTLINLSDIIKDYYLTSSSECGFLLNLTQHQILSIKAGVHFSITKIFKETYPATRNEKTASILVAYGWKF